jgi:hypothetical protein
MAKLYFAFFQSKHHQTKWGSSQQKPHQKMFLEFSKLGLDCSLNISHACHDTTFLIFGLNLFKWKMVFKKEFELTKS